MNEKRKPLRWLFTTRITGQYKLYHYIRHRGDIVIHHNGIAEDFDRSKYEYDVLFNYDKGDEPLTVDGAINGHILSVRKDVVDKYFAEAFGYSLMIDPEKHRGFAVRKSTKQATHSGVIVQTPCRPDLSEFLDGKAVLQRYVYQRLIDNRIFSDTPIHKQSMQLVRDLRVSVMFGEIVCVYIKDKSQENLFHPHRVDEEYVTLVTDVLRVMSKTERNQILDFARRMRIDYAELDVLRDNSTGLLYIVDVNNVPAASLFSKLGDTQLQTALELHTACIDRHIDKFIITQR